MRTHHWFQKVFFFLYFVTIYLEDGYSAPVEDTSSGSIPLTIERRSFRGFLPKIPTISRPRRAESGTGGIGNVLQTAIKDGISVTSAFTSPTMFVGGFTMMMQPMPNGTELAGQVMDIIPHYLSMLPQLLQAFPGAGRAGNLTQSEQALNPSP